MTFHDMKLDTDYLFTYLFILKNDLNMFFIMTLVLFATLHAVRHHLTHQICSTVPIGIFSKTCSKTHFHIMFCCSFLLYNHIFREC